MKPSVRDLIGREFVIEGDVFLGTLFVRESVEADGTCELRFHVPSPDMHRSICRPHQLATLYTFVSFVTVLQR